MEVSNGPNTGVVYNLMSAEAASIIGAIIVTIGGIIGAYMNKVHKDNRADHSYVANRLSDLHADVKDVKKDITDVKVDVSVLKNNHKHMKEHIDRIEENI